MRYDGVLAIWLFHTIDVSNGHDQLVDVRNAKEMTFTGTRAELRDRLEALKAAGATGFIFGTSGVDVEREMHAYADLVGL